MTLIRLAKLSAAVLACALLATARGGGTGDASGAPASNTSGSPVSTAPSAATTDTTPTTSNPTTSKSVALEWSGQPTTPVSGTTTLQLAGQAFDNVEIFSADGKKVALAVISPDKTSATATIDTTQFANGAVTLTAHAWDSPAGTAFTSDADAGALTLMVANTVATTTTSTTATAPALVTASASDLSITAYGAVCNGRTDDSTAIANTIAAAKAKGVRVVIPAATCAYGNVIRLDSVKLIGSGDSSVLYALNPSLESIFMYGNGAEVRQVKLSGNKATVRQAPWEATRITLFGATNFVIDHVTIDGSAAAGIQTAQSANNGSITYNTISNTLSDSIHLADKASYITIEHNRISNAGDDGIAVVSSIDEGGLVDHITARYNVVLNNLWGRNMSVVGGSNVLYENNVMDGNSAKYACMYIAQEDSWATYGSSNVVVQLNTMKNCGGTSTGHGAVLVFSAGRYANNNITLSRNDISQNGQPGIVVQSVMNNNVVVDSNRITGASPALTIAAAGAKVTAYSAGMVGASGY